HDSDLGQHCHPQIKITADRRPPKGCRNGCEATAGLRSTSTLSARGVPPMEDHDISVWILYEAHVADAGVFDSDHLRAGGARLLDGRLDIGDLEGDAILVRDELLALFLRSPKR